MTTRLLPFKRSTISGLGGILLTTLGGAVGCSFDSDSISFVPDDQLGSGNAAGTAGATGATAGTGGSAIAGSSGSSGSSAGGSGGTAGSMGGTGGNMGGSAGTAGSGGNMGGSAGTAGSGGSSGTGGTGGSAAPSITFKIKDTEGSVSFGRPEVANFFVQVNDFPGLKMIEVKRPNQPTNTPPLFSISSGNVLEGQMLITSGETGTFVATAYDMVGGTITADCNVNVSWQGGDNAWGQAISFDFDRIAGDLGMGYDKAQAVAVADDNTIYVGGYSYRGGGPGDYGTEKRIAFLRTNKDAAVEGSYILASAVEQEVRGLAVQANSTVSFAGVTSTTTGSEMNNAFIGAVNINAAGVPNQAGLLQTIWDDSMDGGGGADDFGLAVATGQGKTIAAGYVNSGDMNAMEVGFIKAYSPNGTGVWPDPYGSDSGVGFKDLIAAVAVDPITNQISFVGDTFLNGTAGLVGRMESDQSNVVSSRIVQSGSDVHLNGIAMLPDGDAIACGTVQPLNNMPPILLAARIHNFADAAVWIKQFPSTKRAQAVGCTADKWGNITLLASQSPDALEARVVRIREDGNVVWDRSIGSGIEPTAIAADQEGSVYIVGVDHVNEALGAGNFYVNKLLL